MLPDTLSVSQRWWLVSLLAVWAVLLFGGFLLGRPDPDNLRRMPLWTRLASSAVLVIAGWSWFLFSGKGSAGSYALMVAFGMVFGALGDVFMAGLAPVSNRVLAGMLAFGIGHLFYIFAILRFSSVQGFDAATPRAVAWLAWLLVGLVGWYVIVFRGQQAGVLHWAALPYALLLASTAGVATGLALQTPAFIPLALGGALFLLSDLILAGQLFSGLSFRLIGDVIWLTYGPAQMLIVYSIGAAWR